MRGKLVPAAIGLVLGRAEHVGGLATARGGKLHSMNFPAPTEEDIQRVVDLVVETAQPLRIVLFGSAVRGELRPGSDLDMMVVVPEGVDTLRAAQRLYVEMAGQPPRGFGVDFIVTTPTRFEVRKHSYGSIYREVAQDGQELYAA